MRPNKVKEFKLTFKKCFSLATRKIYYIVSYKNKTFIGDTMSECIREFEKHLKKKQGGHNEAQD